VEQVDTEQVDMEQVDTEVVATELAQAACMVGAMVPLAAAMVAHAESPLEKNAPLVGSAAVAEDLVRVLCLT